MPWCKTEAILGSADESPPIRKWSLKFVCLERMRRKSTEMVGVSNTPMSQWIVVHTRLVCPLCWLIIKPIKVMAQQRPASVISFPLIQAQSQTVSLGWKRWKFEELDFTKENFPINFRTEFIWQWSISHAACRKVSYRSWCSVRCSYVQQFFFFDFSFCHWGPFC